MGDVLSRNNISIQGAGRRPMMLAHGYGCDQNMWRYFWPAFATDRQIILFDHVGAGRSQLAAYDPAKYASLEGYASDVIEICERLQLTDTEFVGHSVGAMIGVLAAVRRPDLFSHLVLVAPSACYINDGTYVGGFSHADIMSLLDQLDSNHLGWSRAMAPVIMGNPDRPALAEELAESFCRTDPAIAKAFARTTFLSDHRAVVARVLTPTLVLQCSQDPIAPESAGRFVHEHIRGSTFVKLRATGHCPHLSAPQETAGAIRRHLDRAGVMYD